MRSTVWILDAKLPRGGVEDLLAGLSARGVRASTRDLPAGRAIVVDDPPADLVAPDGVLRTATVEIPTESAVTRRAFIDAFAGALALAVVGACVGVGARFATPPAAARDDELGEIEAGSLAELRAQGSLRFRFGREPCILVTAGDEIFAVSLVCTHLGCLVEWRSDRRQLVCPCHRASFDLEGNVLEGPPPRPLTTFAVSTAGDRVLVRRRTA